MNLAKSSILATVALGLLGIGLITGRYIVQSTADFSLLEKRLTLVENASDQGVSTEKIRLLMQRLDEVELKIASTQTITPLSQNDNSFNLSDLEDRQSKLETYVYSLLRPQEQQAQSEPFGAESQNIQDDHYDQSSSSREQLHAGIELLDLATMSGELDKTSMDKLDKIVDTLDRESSKRFWERMFADIQEGRYQLPDEEPPSDYYELPNDEAVGE